MPARTTATAHHVPVLIRTKSGTADDTIYANGATVPGDADTGSFSAMTPPNSGKGHASEVELFVVSVNASGTVQARGSCSFDLRIIHVVERQWAADPGDTWPDVSVATEPLTGQALQSAIRVPWNGGKMYVGVENVASAPAGHSDFQVWAKPVAG